LTIFTLATWPDALVGGLGHKAFYGSAATLKCGRQPDRQLGDQLFFGLDLDHTNFTGFQRHQTQQREFLNNG
jgi:hypothetical protein